MSVVLVTEANSSNRRCVFTESLDTSLTPAKQEPADCNR